MKKILVAIIGLAVVVSIIAGVKFLQIRKMIDQGASFVPPPTKVTVSEVQEDEWESLLTSVGSLVAVQGVTVSADLPGKVVEIKFEAGGRVEAGDLLLLQDTRSEEAQLPGAEAAVVLARSNLERSRQLLAKKVIPVAEHDAAVAEYRQAVAQADNIRAAINKKKVRAPFAGRLGIRLVNLGQYLKEGDGIVSLQSLDPIYVNFLLPQQALVHLRPGLPVRITTDSLPGETIEGRITTVNPEVDPATRNIRTQATIANPDDILRPGMYADLAVVLPTDREVLAIPTTAVLYAPYGDSVFLVEEKKDEKTGKVGKVLRQQFVRLGESRGDFMAVTEGLQGGETIVSTGVFKLRNGMGVEIDNTLAPNFALQPTPENN
ncbi:MAG TPA: efflux transporter periplasmic adaptor subunit [Desulfobulbaceae bacterium]|nr:efflux transporter periplasmic adaptor subunit [Desulfobulbaceae bacterium]